MGHVSCALHVIPPVSSFNQSTATTATARTTSYGSSSDSLETTRCWDRRDVIILQLQGSAMMWNVWNDTKTTTDHSSATQGMLQQPRYPTKVDLDASNYTIIFLQSTKFSTFHEEPVTIPQYQVKSNMERQAGISYSTWNQLLRLVVLILLVVVVVVTTLSLLPIGYHSVWTMLIMTTRTNLGFDWLPHCSQA